VATLTQQIPAASAGGPVREARPRRPFLTRPLLFVVALAVAAIAVVIYLLRPEPAPVITTRPLVRKTLVSLVTATGTVNPKQTISVGTQVSGTIEEIVADYNDKVHKGQVLARLDPTLLQASLAQAQATLAEARARWQAALADSSGANSTTTAAYANVDAAVANARVVQAATISADANVTKSQAALELADQTLASDKALLAPGFISQNQYETDEANEVAAATTLRSAVVGSRQARMQLGSARSTVAAGVATGTSAASQATGFSKIALADLAAIDAASALVETATVNRRNTVIKSPVDGTVIARNVSIGQTVAASFQTPTLYTIAQNLAEMEIDLAAGEPDIGDIHTGQPVDFTVLAYPDHVFHETVAQVRYNPTTVQNVVTYDTVLYENNSDGLLRPGMTVSASIETARAVDALVVSLTALDFHAAAAPGTAPSAAPPSVWGDTGASATAALAAGSLATVTVVNGSVTRSVPVRILLISGGQAAIEPIGQTLAVGSRIAVAVAPRATAAVAQPATAARAPNSMR